MPALGRPLRRFRISGLLFSFPNVSRTDGPMADLLKSVPSWNRLCMRDIGSPYLSTGSFSAVYAASDAEVLSLNPSDYGSLAGDIILIQVEVPGGPSVVVAVRILTHTQETPLCLQSGSATGDLERMMA